MSMSRSKSGIPGILIALAALLPASILPASAASYKIDPQHTEIQFRVRHLGISSVTGVFSSFEGEFEFDPARVEGGNVEVEIDPASIDTKVEDRDEHLRSADFFDVAEHPEIRFRSTSVESRQDSLAVAGDLTIRGVTRPVVLEVEFNGAAVDPWGNSRVGFTASAQINRKEFGLTWNKALEAGGLLVGEKVEILLDVQGIEQQAEAAPAE